MGKIRAMNFGTEQQVGVNQLVRHVGLLGLTSVVGGVLIGGLGGRIIMGISANAAGQQMVGRLTENGNRIGEFTIGGSLAVVVFGGLLGGMFAAVVVVAAEPWLAWLRWLRGLGYGLVLIAVFTPLDSIDFLILEPAALNVAMFLGLALTFGLSIPIGYRFLDRRLPAAGETEQPGYIVLAALGAFPLFLLLLFFTSSEFCGCDPAYAVGALLLLMIASTAVRSASRIVNTLPGWLVRGATITGYGSLVLILALGLNETADQLRLIL